MTSVTYNYTGGQQSFVVPVGITEVKITCWGAAGRSDTRYTYGYGGATQGTITVTPGETLYVYVGGAGQIGTGGWNGGGNGGPYGAYESGGGGGATDVRQGGTALGNRVIVAGGGGGTYYNAWYGGFGGGLTGGTGQNTTGGTGGTQSAGGSIGGSLGQGGHASASYCGGGGGGYYGGGAGSGTGGGGGGSGYLTPSATGAIHETGVRPGNGQVKIEYTTTNVSVFVDGAFQEAERQVYFGGTWYPHNPQLL